MEERTRLRAVDAFDLRETIDEGPGTRVALTGDAGDALGPDERHVDRAGGYQQTLVRADVRRRLAAADVLLARLQGQRVANATVEVDGPANYASGHLPDELVAATHEAEVRTARRHWNPEGLAIADRDVRAVAAPFAGWHERTERDRIDHGHDEHPGSLGGIGEGVHVLEATEEVRLLDDEGGIVLACAGGERVRRQGAAVVEGQFHELDPLIADNGLRRRAIERVQRPCEEDALGLRLPIRADRHKAGFCETRAAVVNRSVGGIHRRQAGDHRLVLIDDLESALTRFGLIRGIGGHELTALYQVPDRGGNVVIVGASSGKAEHAIVARSSSTEIRKHLHFGNAVRQVLKRRRAKAVRDFVE